MRNFSHIQWSDWVVGTLFQIDERWTQVSGACCDLAIPLKSTLNSNVSIPRLFWTFFYKAQHYHHRARYRNSKGPSSWKLNHGQTRFREIQVFEEYHILQQPLVFIFDIGVDSWSRMSWPRGRYFPTHRDRFNTLRPKQSGRHLPNDFSWMKMFNFRLRFHWRLFPMIKLTIFQH